MVNAAGEALKITSPEISKLIHDTFQRIDPKNYEPKLVDDVIQDHSNGSRPLMPYKREYENFQTAACALSALGKVQVNMSSPIVKLN